MFAGPNGSGKSTIFQNIKKDLNIDFGTYVNADVIEKQINSGNPLSFSEYNLKHHISSLEFNTFLSNHSLYRKALASGYKIDLTVNGNNLITTNTKTFSYEAAIIADFIRHELIRNSKKITFETVMSHRSKIETLKKSQEQGYRNYLYFISTESEEININRVASRVKQGGHNVPIEKIRQRYFNSLNFLFEAIRYTYKAYIFDNSKDNAELILEIKDGQNAVVKSQKIPAWVDKYILKKPNKG